MYRTSNRLGKVVSLVVQISTRSINDSKRDLSKIRNIGILAHIDAGKTTTTERMLYYSGRISTMGEVHDGNTVTDYLDQERDRGITITSAFVGFKWNGHVVNLVDTPGHIDFTMEVEQALRVIDSAVIILDATAGVEAQTITVWQQARSQNLPSLIYINKMDRDGANVDVCLKTLRTKLLCNPLLLHLPVLGKGGFEGVVDLPSFEKIVWTKKGLNCTRKMLNSDDSEYPDASEARIKLIDDLSSLDDQLADQILDIGSLEGINREQIVSALKRVTSNQKAIPVICGSSYKNIGIEALLDSIVDYLPSPADSKCVLNDLHSIKQTLARSFKIIHDKQRGAIVFFRVYSGELSKGQKIFNITRKIQDQVGKILVPFADDFKEIPEATAGSFVALTGVKETMNGDLICGSQNELKKIGDKLEKHNMSKEEVLKVLDGSQNIPNPVFFCSVEPYSQAYQQSLERALHELQREDPSLQVTFDDTTGQTVLAGMGELHLEIIKDRIKSNYNIDVDLGTIQIVYKEEFTSSVKHTITLKNAIGSHEQNVLITMSLKPGTKKDILVMDTTADSAANLAHLSPKVINRLKAGVKAALMRGPLYSSEVINVHVVLHWFEAHRATSDTLLTAAASQCVQEILKIGDTRLLEPIMKLTITLPSEYCSVVVSDLSRRRGNIASLVDKGGYKEISGETPLSGLLGYATHLRTITSGTANLSMEFDSYRPMSSEESESVLNGLCAHSRF